MNGGTLKTELDPGSWIVNVLLLKPAQLFGLLNLDPLRSSALDVKYCDNDFEDDEEEARSSSNVLILALGCEIPATLEPHLKQNLPPGFTSGTKLHHFGWGKPLLVADCWRK